ncbi:sulfotransferase [Marinomonas sp. GJ51-6]|uniref:sulfotransferase family protein n=1 Tax=Marinomonas sp. GJ51-6 TaxID=2992802 RepID=UPI002934CD01|nr:sulfotransferase [Marinomonas sp. GJ51-6]WOD06187.1 sulfotransferase [Marinomonas sp. GJ51-6]
MPPQFHFISGLPRSGSTLFSALLRQNPAFYADISSPVMGLVESVISQTSAGSEMAPLVSEERKIAVTKGIFANYYSDVDKQVIFDTNRGWTARLSLLDLLFPQSKVICLARNVAWVLDSMERQICKSPMENTKLFNNNQQRSTVYSRVESMASQSGLVGFGWHALRDGCFSDYAENLLIIDYDLLVRKPASVMQGVYQFLDLPFFQHNFDNVEFDSPAFDQNLGVDGLHRVHKEVMPRERETILPPELFEKYSNMMFWRDLKSSKAFTLAPSR